MKYQAFLDAESRGRFFLAHIRDHFRYERLANSRPLAVKTASAGRLRLR